MVRRRSASWLLGLGFSLLTVSAADAAPIQLMQWYNFGFAYQGMPATGGDTGVGVNSLPSGDPSWTFDAPAGGVTVFLTDGFGSGDSFTLLDNDVPVGSTPPMGFGGNCANDENACLFDPDISHGLFELGEGPHSLDVLVDESLDEGGQGFFYIEPNEPDVVTSNFTLSSVPEPGTYLLLATGLAGLWWRKRR